MSLHERERDRETSLEGVVPASQSQVTPTKLPEAEAARLVLVAACPRLLGFGVVAMSAYVVAGPDGTKQTVARPGIAGAARA